MECDNPKKAKYSDDEQKKIVEFMQPVFEQYLQPDDLLPHMPLFDEILKEEIMEIVQIGQRRTAVIKMMTEVLQDPHLTREFIEALRTEGYQRFLDIIDDNDGDEKRKRISELYEVVLKFLEGELQRKIVPSDVIIHMPDISESDKEQINLEEERKGPIHTCRLFFRIIKKKYSDWPLKFLEALYKHHKHIGPDLINKIAPEVLQDENRELLCIDGDQDEESLSLDDELPSYDDEQNIQLPARTASSDGGISPASQQDHTQVTAVVTERGNEQNSTTHQRMGNFEIAEENSTSDESVDFSDEEKQDQEGKEKCENKENSIEDLHMREYQLELAENALKGQNTIICAPTGSGKTRVALYIIKHHLEKTPADRRKVIFLARTVPLVTQQHAVFLRHLSDKYQILPMTGENEDSANLHQLIEHYDIIVLTPQILENHFKLKKIKSLSTFSLMVFDECHHTRKGEPYNMLMMRYLKSKLRDDKTKLPQVVGLTASLGVEKATTDDEAKLSILRLCANMDAQNISTVRIHKDELSEKVPVPEEMRVPLFEKRNDPGRNEMEKLMLKIEDMLIDENDLDDRSIDRLLMSRPNDRNCQAYGQWAVQIKTAAKLAETKERHENKNKTKAEMARLIIGLAESLITYNEALEIHDIVHIRDVLEYLSKKFHQCDGYNHLNRESELIEMFKELKKKFIKLQQRGNNQNPNLELLASTLERLLKEKGEDARGIIFVRTRATCYALANWFKSQEVSETLKRLNATAFTGAGAHEEEGGMTQNDQETIISKFKAGEINLIIATSVAEEGLDIPECNIILKYNHVGNEISTIQTRGRSRKAGGTSILLGSSKILQKEMLNVARGVMMQKAIETVMGMDSSRYQQRILSLQKESMMKEDIKDEVRRHLTNRKTAGEFTLVCSRCRQYCITNTDLRTINKTHHVVVGDDFNGRVQIIPDKKQKKPFDGIHITGKIRCKKCHSLWGVMFIYQGVSFPSLGIKYLTVVDKEDNPRMYKKWLDVPYNITDIGLDDFKRVLTNRSNAEIPTDGDGSQAEGGSGSLPSGSGSHAEGRFGSHAEGGFRSQADGCSGSGSQAEDGFGLQADGGSGSGSQAAHDKIKSDQAQNEERVEILNEKKYKMEDDIQNSEQTEVKIIARGEPDGGEKE